MLTLILLGLITGIASASFGIGGGLIMVPAFLWLLKMPYPQAVAHSLVLIVPISLVGSLVNTQFTQFYPRVLILCAIGGAIGALIGTFLLHNIPTLWIKRAFALFILYAAWKLWTGK
ncbi:MAG: sulfite exporter TauE/SafE family protein [Methylacidiphilales bacterium]|nr:sulfite exporter TauE/SafE family protein [Candidatus Methylacidiphilales bacterium]MDW8349773.1 sulfite exporter TauE/SafE family protein [Verrucomicrobiae bacterium]